MMLQEQKCEIKGNDLQNLIGDHLCSVWGETPSSDFGLSQSQGRPGQTDRQMDRLQTKERNASGPGCHWHGHKSNIVDVGPKFKN